MVGLNWMVAREQCVTPAEFAAESPDECSAQRRRVPLRTPAPPVHITRVTSNRAEYWQIRDLEPLDIDLDDPTSWPVAKLLAKSTSQTNSAMRLSVSGEHDIPRSKCGNNELNAVQGSGEMLKDSVIWAPPIKERTIQIIKGAFLKPSYSVTREESSVSGERVNMDSLTNINANDDADAPKTVGAVYRRLSHPDFQQNISHWINVYFDFNMGQENRIHMKIRRDLPFRYCCPVIGFTLGDQSGPAEDSMVFLWPSVNCEMDKNSCAYDLDMNENEVIIVRTD